MYPVDPSGVEIRRLPLVAEHLETVCSVTDRSNAAKPSNSVVLVKVAHWDEAQVHSVRPLAVDQQDAQSVQAALPD